MKPTITNTLFLGLSFCLCFSLSAQVYTDKVQVVEGLEGNVGIGTNAPGSKLEIIGDLRVHDGSVQHKGVIGFGSSDVILENNVSGNHVGEFRIKNFNGSGYNDAFFISGNGNIGIGTVSPSFKLDLLGNLRIASDGTFAGPAASFRFFSGNVKEGDVRNYTSGDRRNFELSNGWGSWRLVAAGDFNIVNWNGAYYDAFFIKYETGNIGIGLSNPTQKLSVNGNASKSSAGDWIANSDARLKKDIAQLSSDESLHKLLQLQGVTYQWADDKTGIERPEGIQYGFTAQNIQEVFPELVEEDNHGYLQTAYGTYDAMMIEAMRALNEKIEKLEQENRRLYVINSKVEQLEKENELLKKNNLQAVASIDTILKKLSQLETQSSTGLGANE
jgi:hypothetical protein